MRSSARPQNTATNRQRQGDERRVWVEALFGPHLPPRSAQREATISTLAADPEVWRALHQARHSMAATTALIERIASAALKDHGPRRAA